MVPACGDFVSDVSEATQDVYMQAAMLPLSTSSPHMCMIYDVACQRIALCTRASSESCTITACTLLSRYCRHVTQQHVSNLCVPVLRSSTECIVLEKTFPEYQVTHWYDFLCVA